MTFCSIPSYITGIFLISIFNKISFGQSSSTSSNVASASPLNALENDEPTSICLSSCLCQPFLGALITPVNPALYFCTLLRLPRDIRRLVSYSSGFVLQTKNQTG